MIIDKIVLLILILCLSNCAGRDGKETTQKKNGQNTIPELLGTKWSYKIADGCINTYHFKADSQYVFYSCEMEDRYYGRYFVQGDTLNLHEYAAAADSLLPADSPERNEQAKFKVLRSHLLSVVGMLFILTPSHMISKKSAWSACHYFFPRSRRNV